jgi:protein-S-isoprenylcysteine O-methyltransferase Ste14
VLGQLIHWLTIPTLVLFSLIVWAYYRLSRLEEQQMCDRYGQKYAIYQWQASVFIPK